jgi:hypothetical protein
MKKKILAAALAVVMVVAPLVCAKKKAKAGKPIDLGFITAEVNYPVSDTWFTEMSDVNKQIRVDAMRAVYDKLISTSTTDNFFHYTQALASGDMDNAISPFGPKDSFSSAWALAEELIADVNIAMDFHIDVVLASPMGTMSLDYYKVELTPVLNDGPKFLVDRYFGVTVDEVTQEWTVTGYHPILEYFVDGNPHYSVDRYADPLAEFQAWENLIPAGLGNNCLLGPAGFQCTATGSYTSTVEVLHGLAASWQDAQAYLESYTAGMDYCSNPPYHVYQGVCNDDWGECDAGLKAALGCDRAVAEGIGYMSICTGSNQEPYYYVIGFIVSDVIFDECQN